MPNIQESLNSILTTGGALKALGEKKELRKVEEEKRKAEEEKRKQKEDYDKKMKENQNYINTLVGQKLKGKINPTDELKKTTRKVIDNDFNKQFIDAEISAAELLRDTYNSETSFNKFHEYRQTNGGNE